MVELVPTAAGLAPAGSRRIETLSVWLEATSKTATRIHLRADFEERRLDAGQLGASTGGGRDEALERELRQKLEGPSAAR